MRGRVEKIRSRIKKMMCPIKGIVHLTSVGQ